MGITNIVNGHLNELLGNNEEIAKARIRICKKCPIMKDSFMGYVCSSKLWLNPKQEIYQQNVKMVINVDAGVDLMLKLEILSLHVQHVMVNDLNYE